MRGNKFLELCVKNNLATVAAMARMKAGAAGWSLGAVEPDKVTGPQVFVYLRETKRDWLWACSIPAANFVKLTEERLTPKDLAEVRTALGARVALYSEVDPTAVSPEAGNELGILASLYAGSTQAVAIAGGLREGGHFFVGVYSDSSAGDTLLRPFVSGAKTGGLAPADMVQATFEIVEAQDRRAHPEWF